jgi:hypothetical protein
MDGVDGSHGHPEADFFGIDAAQNICGTGRALKLLIENILKIYPVPFKARSIDICQVITNNVHPGLVILKS